MLRKEILELRWKAGIGLMAFLTMAMSSPGLYWYMENNAEFKAQFQVLPPEIAGRLSDYQSLLHSNWFGQNLLQIGTVLAVIIGCSAIAGEASKRTMAFLLSKPISRFRVLATKMAVGTVALGLVVLISSAAIYPASTVLGYDVSLVSLLLAGIQSWLGLAVMFSLAVLYSAIFDDAIKTAAFALLTALVLAVPGWFASISQFSIYNHMQSFTAFKEGTIPVGDVAFLIASFTVLAGIAYLLFRGKEF